MPAVPPDFDNFTGCVRPDLLETGDLLFVGRLDAPTLMGKPDSNTPLKTQQSFVDFMRQLLSLETLTKAGVSLPQRPSMATTLNNHLNTAAAGYYSGHVAMVLVENGVRYVIEAGTQDYSNYRVAVHPYYLESETDETHLSTMRGWANRRWFQNDKIWVLRYANGLSVSQKLTVSHYAKSMLGRPYGILDTLKYADESRFYCSDFVLQCYGAAGIKLDEKRTWKWFLESPTINALGVKIPNNDVTIKRIIESLDIAAAILQKINLDSLPPGLSIPMVYYSSEIFPIHYDADNLLMVKKNKAITVAYGVG